VTGRIPGDRTTTSVAIEATAPVDLAEVRRSVADVAALAGLSDDRTSHFTVAVNEIVTNALTHGIPPATVNVSGTDGCVVVTVHDRGPGWDRDREPPASTGPTTPATGEPHGRGLWLVSQFCDRMEVFTDATGTTVSLWSYRG
jgi:anti-sigma regulatory factor (Ser/Thr protein kinase)